MILASLDGDRIAVECPPTYNSLLKRIPGARYRNGWTVPLAWSACLQLRAELGEMLSVGPDLAEWARGYLERRASVLSAQDGGVLAPGLDPRLSPQQAQAATWLAWVGRGLLVTEMRTGKTPMTIEALAAVGDAAFPALLVVPNTTKFVWADEFDEWDDGVTHYVLHGTPTQRRKTLDLAAEMADRGAPVVVITNWESLRGLSRLAAYGSLELTDKEKQDGPLNSIAWQTVVADEAHRAVNPKAKQTLALKHLMHEAPRRILLTGTPVVNDGGDLYSLWHLCAPEEAPVRSTWLERYTNCGMGQYGWEIFGFKPERSAEMFEVLGPRFLRRTLREMRPNMPDKLPVQIRRSVLEGKQAKTYADLKKNMLAVLQTETGEDGLLVVTDPLVLAGRLAYAAAATPVLDEAGSIVSLALPSVKVEVLREVLAEYPGEPLVVFAPSRKLIELCERELTKDKTSFVSIHGKIDPQLRAANIANFQAGLAQVALCTTGAGAEGVTLNRASRTLFLGRDWSNAKNIQAEARTDGREGGDPLETIISVVSDTIEERVLEVGDVKAGYLQELVRDALR